MKASRRVMWSGVAVGALLVGASGLGFACVPTDGAALEEVNPVAAPVGSQIRLGGTGWKSSDPVNVLWSEDGEAMVEPALATTRSAGDNGSFSVWVTVPDSSPGVHYFVAIQGETRRSAAFQVLAPGTSPTGSGADGDPSGISGSSSGTASGGMPGLEQPTAPAAADHAGTAGDPSPNAPLTAVAAQPAQPDSLTRAAEAAGGAPAAAADATAAPAGPDEVVAEKAPEPAAPVVPNDLWSRSAPAAPGLPDLHAEQQASGFRPGLVLATAGVMIAFAGYAVQEVVDRRRRLAPLGGDELGRHLDD